MKSLNFFLIALLIVSLFDACKKDTPEEPVVVPVSIEGNWTGKLIYPDRTEESFNLTISKDNNVLELKTKEATFTGTWLLKGNIFTADFTASGFNLTGTFDSAAGKIMDGTIRAATDNSDSGTWSMTKDK